MPHASTAALLRKLQSPGPSAAATTSDRELLRQFTEHRDEAAFAAIVRRYAAMVLGVGLRALHHRQDAEDVCQATFLTLAQKAATIRWRDSVAGWLYDVAHRHACNARAAANRRAAHTTRAANRPQPAAADEVTLRELQTALDEELARLPEKYRTPLVLCCLEGLTRDEAAQYLGLALATVKSRLEEGRERLRRRLVRRGLTLSAVLAGYTLMSNSAAQATWVAELVRATTPAATGIPSSGVSATAAALAREGASTMTRKALGILLSGSLVAGLLAAGLAATPTHTPALPQPAANRTADPQPRADRHGDALPDGALLRLGTTRLRHANVFSLAFTPDGKLVSFGRDYAVKTWNPATGELLRERAFEKDSVHRHQWGGRLSPDGTRLAVQKEDNVTIFDVDSGKALAAIKLGSIWEVMGQFSPDGKTFAVADQNKDGMTSRLQLCDVATNTCREFGEITGYSSEPVFSRDGTRLALTQGSAVVVWELATGKVLLRFKPEGLIGGRIDFDPTGDVLAVLGAINPPQSFYYVQISTGKPPEGWTVPAVINFEWVRFSPDGKSIFLGGRESLVCCDAKTGKQQYKVDGWAATPPAFSRDGKLVASGRRNAVQLWDVASGRSAMPEKLRDAPEEELAGVAFSPDGKWIITKSNDTGLIRIWDSDGQPKGSIKSLRSGARYPLFSADGRHLFGIAADAVALVKWDFPNGKEVTRYTFAEPATDQVFIYHFGLSADGKKLAAVTQTTNRQPRPGGGGGGGGWGGETATFTLWDVASAKRLEVREVESKGFVSYGAFAPDLRWYYHADRAYAIGGGPDLTLDLPPQSFAQQGAASTDGRLVAQLVGSYTGDDRVYRVVVHETATGKRVLELPTNYCGPIAFTPDGRQLLVTDTESITRWDLATGKPVVRHKSPGRFSGSYGGAFASSLVVTTDGKRAATGQSDTTAIVWDITPPARPAAKLGEREMLAAWNDLGGADAGKAYAAVWALSDAGADAVPLLAARLKPAAAPTEERVKKLIAQLGAEEFADREAAERELRELGDAAVPALQAALKGVLTIEQLRRADKILAAADAALLTPGERLRAVRAVAVLERVGTKAARELLAQLAKGPATDRLTREATAALKRLGE